MSSLQTRAAQQDRGQGYFVPVASLVGQVYAYSGTSAAGASGSFSTAQWAYYGAGLSLSSINAAGAGILKDMGRTVVSSSRTFRKVQVVLNKQNVNTNASTFGVGGQAGTTYPAGGDYLTGYIEMGFDGVGTPAPVAAFGR
jgi:hypothetical protein